MLGSTVPRKVSHAAQTAALMSSWLTVELEVDTVWMAVSFMVLYFRRCSTGGVSEAFGERLKLLLAVVNELVEGLALATREIGQGNDALLVRQRWH